MVDIRVSISEEEGLTRVYCTWYDILNRECREHIEIRNDQIPELVQKLKSAYESTGIIDVEPVRIE